MLVFFSFLLLGLLIGACVAEGVFIRLPRAGVDYGNVVRSGIMIVALVEIVPLALMPVADEGMVVKAMLIVASVAITCFEAGLFLGMKFLQGVMKIITAPA